MNHQSRQYRSMLTSLSASEHRDIQGAVIQLSDTSSSDAEHRYRYTKILSPARDNLASLDYTTENHTLKDASISLEPQRHGAGIKFAYAPAMDLWLTESGGLGHSTNIELIARINSAMGSQCLSSLMDNPDPSALSIVQEFAEYSHPSSRVLHEVSRRAILSTQSEGVFITMSIEKQTAKKDICSKFSISTIHPESYSPLSVELSYEVTQDRSSARKLIVPSGEGAVSVIDRSNLTPPSILELYTKELSRSADTAQHLIHSIDKFSEVPL